MESGIYAIIALILGFLLDQLLGDPARLPHPIVAFGKAISFFEKCLNKGKYRLVKGSVVAIVLIGAVFVSSFCLIAYLEQWLPEVAFLVQAVLVFYCLAARSLRMEVKQVFEQLELSLDAGRKQVSRIVGRDTQALNEQQISRAALETLAENLSDGVVAPLFWFAVLGVPGMLAYKMVNTLDSMVGYKSERYEQYGKFAARFDDFCNYIPARLTTLLMLASRLEFSKLGFVCKQGKNHSSPNSGYPESALAAILDCRFGGPNNYFGKVVEKPYIGTNERDIRFEDMQTALRVNRRTEWLMLGFAVMLYGLIYH